MLELKNVKYSFIAINLRSIQLVSVYSTAPSDWVFRISVDLGVMPMKRHRKVNAPWQT